MKALTVQQPWAWALVHGGKDVENRTQAWSYRGPLAIHAGARWSARGEDNPLYLAAMARERSWVRHRIDVTGAILGVVDLVAVHTAEPGCCESPWAEQAYDEHGGRTRRDIVHLEVDNPRPLATPVSAKGRLGLWTPEPDVLAAVLEQLGEGDSGVNTIPPAVTTEDQPKSDMIRVYSHAHIWTRVGAQRYPIGTWHPVFGCVHCGDACVDLETKVDPPACTWPTCPAEGPHDSDHPDCNPDRLLLWEGDQA